LLGQGLQIERSLKDQTKIAFCLAALAWIAVREQHSERAATLIGAAETLFQAMELPFSTLQTLETDHHKAVATARLIGERAYGTAHRRGSRMSAEEAISFALGEDPHKRSDRETRDATPKLTRREQAIAELIAEGLTNRAIADRLVIAQRTAEGHVEHILSKLGFTSRAQIAAWVAEHRSGGAND
jgi:non-specific serine/threonine protein kinase